MGKRRACSKGTEQHPGDRNGRLEEIFDGTLADILDEPVLVSAMTCERAGADPPRAAELLDRLPLPDAAAPLIDILDAGRR
jgi:hypothetical protein